MGPPLFLLFPTPPKKTAPLLKRNGAALIINHSLPYSCALVLQQSVA